jgi:hypothetical protein
VPVEDCTPPTTLEGFNESEESKIAGAGSGDCSNSQTAGFGSLSGTATNLEGEITYTAAVPPEPELIVIVPLPFVGDAEIEYVALKPALALAPFELLMSSLPVNLPVGLMPSAVNSPEKTFTPNATGLLAYPP